MNHDATAARLSPSQTDLPCPRGPSLVEVPPARLDDDGYAGNHPATAPLLKQPPAATAPMAGALDLPACPSQRSQSETSSVDKAPAFEAPIADAVLASFENLRLGSLSRDYMTHLHAGQAAWSTHDGMVARDTLGTLHVVRGALDDVALQVPPFELTCERLSAACDVSATYGGLLRCLEDPATRAQFLEKNDAGALRQVKDLAASGVMRAAADHRKVSDQIAMANCNASLDGFMTRMLATGKLQANEPRVLSYQATRAWVNHTQVLEACAPIAEQIGVLALRNGDDVGTVTHETWLPWFERSEDAFMQGVTDIWPRMLQILTD